MKIVCIFITLIFLSKTSKSQTFVDTTKLWNVLQCYSGPFGSDCETYSYRLSGDTTLGVYQYKKLLQTNDTTLIYWSLKGAMRDSGQKVFYTDFFNEYLLYDFGANVGDTIRSIFFCQDTLLVVDSVDTVMIDADFKRRLFFNFSNCGFTEVWIEDIGSIFGIASSFTVYGDLPSDYGEELLCYWKNDTVRWINPVYNDCYYVVLDIVEENEFTIKIFPNPINDLATIDLHGINSDWNWRLYNNLGQVVQTTENIYSSRFEINRGALPSGVYFYYIDSKDAFISKGKLIIN